MPDIARDPMDPAHALGLVGLSQRLDHFQRSSPAASSCVPTGALFRDGDSWAAFAVEDDRAVLRRLELGRQNGLEAQVVSGLGPGRREVLYPTELVRDGTSVEPRTWPVRYPEDP